MCPENEALFSLLRGADLKEQNGVTLAFLGDAVYELLVREHVLSVCGGRVRALHEKTVAFSNAAFQSAAAGALLPDLTEEETAVFRRGRNAHTGHVPKNKSTAQYHLATGLEAVFGYLCLTGNAQRILELFAKIIKLNEETEYV